MYVTVDFLGIKIGALTLDDMIDEVLAYALKGEGRFITYLNAHCVNIFFSDSQYKRILQSADLIYAGGQGVVWATRFCGTPLPERVNILDFFEKLVKGLKVNKISVYLLGGTQEIVKKTEQVLKNKGLRIIGCRDGFFKEAEEKKIIDEINALKPDILIVGMGVPKQEKWINAHLDELNVRLCWAVGASFDWLSGARKRAPGWMRKCGFEWLHRLYQQPRRLWKRYLIGNIIFLCHVLSWRIRYDKYS